MQVKALRVGAFYHGTHGCERIAECAWHPLGTDGASLVVLTEDGIVREYHIAGDVDEPAQTVSVLHGGAASRAAAWSADDDDEQKATAMAWGPLRGDASPRGATWHMFTLWVLTRSGDVHALCPFMPKHATLPRAALTALAGREAQRSDAAPLAQRFVKDLVRQSSDEPMRASTPGATLASLDESFASASAKTSHVAVTLPASVPHRVAPQGPCLLRPAPRELDDELASVACGLWTTSLCSDDESADLDVVVMTTRDGSVHIMALPAPIEPRWSSAPTPAPPVLVVYESIDLQLPAPHAELLEHNAMQCVADPLYPDLFYVTHRYGVHAIGLHTWAPALLEAAARHDSAATQRAVAERAHSDVAWVVRMPADAPAIVTGAVVLHDVYLSYTLLVLTADTQLAALDLALRVALETSRDVPSDKGYKSLVHEMPFEVPRVLREAPARVQASAAPIKVDAAALRSLGQAAAAMRAQLQAVAEAGAAVQARVATQMHEMQRQLAQLARASAQAEALRPAALAERLARLESSQASALKRLDALLQRLMDAHAPQLSLHEKRWFDELQRMSREFQPSEGRGGALEHMRKVG